MTTLQPWFHFDTRDLRTVQMYPHDGLTFAEWELGDHHIEVYYLDGSWWFDDGLKTSSCRDLLRAMRLFWRRAGAIIG
jgi:hypothetical protein